MLMRIGSPHPPYVGCAYGLDDEPVLTADGEAAAAICGCIQGRPDRAADPKAAADAIVAEIEQATTKKGAAHAERLLDRPHRCERRRGLQAVHRGQWSDLQEVWRQGDRTRRAVR